MTDRRPDLRLWLFGLTLFFIVVLLGIWLKQSSGIGIVDHQIAGTAERVNEIQMQWRTSGMRWLAIAAMTGDLIFIGVYSLGAWRAGRSISRISAPLLSVIGWIIAVAAVAFCFTDYVETILQFIQLVREQGSDTLARTAAAMQGMKVASWIVTFVGVLLGLAIAHFSHKRA